MLNPYPTPRWGRLALMQLHALVQKRPHRTEELTRADTRQVAARSLRQLRPGDIVVMDSLAAQDAREARELMERAGAALRCTALRAPRVLRRRYAGSQLT
jgi:hypothetical protein